MFVQSAKFIQAHSGKRGAISVYGQEANADTWKMAKMNMAIRGIDADFGPYHADTFTNDFISVTLTSIRQFITTKQYENQQLAALRDALLPKLMSGELDVSDLDI